MGWVLHATRRAECGGNGREDGDYDVEDLAPSAVVVECSHSGLGPLPIPSHKGREYNVLGDEDFVRWLVIGPSLCSPCMGGNLMYYPMWPLSRL